MSKPRIKVSQYNLDAWQNAASGMGIAGIDKNLYDKFSFIGAKIDWQTLSWIYRYDWLAKKICDRPAKDAVRRWIVTEDKNLLTQFETLKAKKKYRQAISWARLYGGAAVLIITDDGRSAEPLDAKKVNKVVDLKVVDRYHLQPVGTVSDPFAVNFSEPEFYTTNNGTVFHHSRVQKFLGSDLTFDEAEREQYWGGSYIELYQSAIKSFQGSMQDVRHIMTESSISELKIPNLTASVVAGGTIFDAIQKRVDQFNLSKSVYRTAVMDKEEDHDFKNRQLTGLADLLDRFMTQVSAATEFPELVLFGKSPKGLNSSQEEQLDVYYDMVRGSIQEEDLMPAINTVAACLSGGNIPEWDFAPLSEPTDKEKAEIRSAEASAVASIASVAMLAPEDIIKHLNSTGHFNLPENDINPNLLDE